MATVDQLTPEVLRRLYEDEGRTETEIAKLYGTYQVKVGRLRAKYGIPTLLKSDRLELPEELTPRLHSILLGSMLGDGRLFRTGSTTASYSEHHCLKQKDYLDWKALEWGVFALRYVPVQDGPHQGWLFTTHGCRVLHPFWQMFYPTGKGDKTYGTMPVELVDPLALAVWFMDDGSKGESSLRFSIGPSEVDREVKLRVLRRLGLKGRHYQSGTDHSIHISDRTNLTKFIDLVQAHIHPSLAYKLEVTPRRRGPAPRDVLTPERLGPLIERGFTAQAIAETFNVSRQSACRAMDRIGATRRVGRPPKGSRQELDLDSATVAVKRFDPASETFKEDVVRVLSQTVLPIVTPTEEDALKDWQRLQTATTRVEGTSFVEESYSGSKLCQRFFQHRWDAKYRHHPSVREAWYDTKLLSRAVQFQMAVNDPVTPVRVFRALQAVVRGPTNFRPCFAKAVVEALCPVGGLVLDPCAGYGGRAVGTLAAGRRYVGVDPHPKAGEAFLGLRGITGELLFYNEPFEDVALGELKADLVFTSPPYFSVERYSEDTAQSWVRYPAWNTWVDGFLRAFVEKSKAHLKPGGRFCVNTKNVRMGRQQYPIADELCRLAREAGFVLEQTLNLPLGRIGSQAQTEPVFVFV